MFGDCQGVGSKTDGSGNTFECLQGHGMQYMGLGNTMSNGEKCARWDRSPDWNPLFAVTHGLEDNFCRVRDDDRRAWCYDKQGSQQSCKIETCGGELASKTSHVQTYEVSR